MAHRLTFLLALTLVGCTPAPDTDPLMLSFVATAEQVGPVAYRDPLGAASPDGQWLAYTSDRFVDVIPAVGGPVQRLGPGASDLRQLVWMGDGVSLAVLERTFDRASQAWYRYDLASGRRTPLWSEAAIASSASELLWAGDPGPVGVVRGDTDHVLLFDGEGAVLDTLASGTRLSNLSAMADGRIACLSRKEETPALEIPCGTPASEWARAVYGAAAFTPDGARVIFARPDDAGRLDLWSRNLDGAARGTRLTFFARDAYAPQISGERLFFKSQDYRVFIATAPAQGGPSSPVTTFMSETPSWDWTGQRIGFTWGDWRRQADDLHYPDITQHIGFVDLAGHLPASAPTAVIRQSPSEDQSLHWSPNGKWIVFHSHLNGDDIWLVPADGSAPPRQITEGGSETGWPRWSPDGRWIQYPSYRSLPGGGRRSDLFVIGVDQETGGITSPAAPVDLGEFAFDAQQGEWAGDSDTIVFEASDGPNSKMIYSVPRGGGRPKLIHRFTSPQVFAGISASPTGDRVAFVAPDPTGWLQIHAVPMNGGTAVPLTLDPSHKTQPAYSPDDSLVAFTVFSYNVHFWSAPLTENGKPDPANQP